MANCAILVILDGLGDRAHQCLNNKTPLQAAHTPALDALAQKGSSGLFHPLAMGMALPSENAHFALFGYEQNEFPGRGFLEAMGYGIPMDFGHVAILAHLACVRRQDDHVVLEESRPKATEEELATLIAAIDFYETGPVRFTYASTKNGDGILLAKGPVSRYITDSDPMIPGRHLSAIAPWEMFANHPPSRATARALEAYLSFCHRTLDNHPINRRRKKEGKNPLNAVVTQRAGMFAKTQPFLQRWGLTAASISSGPVFWGLSEFLGISVIQDADTTQPGKDLARRIDLAIKNSQDFDLIHVHTKAPDVAAHTKNPVAKKEVIEALDHGIMEAMSDHADRNDILWVVTSDHSTPSDGPLIHSGEPVPIVMAGKGVRVDAVDRFDEIACATGALGNLRQKECLLTILNYLDRAKLAGIMDTPTDQPYWPGRTTPLKIRKKPT